MNCEHCGANLSLEDMTRPNCPYCHNVLKHHARAAEHAVLVNKVLADRIGAQYPGLPPGQVPQIGYQFGAPLDPSFGRFQAAQTDKAIKRAMWITVLAFAIPVVLLLVMGVGFALWFLM
ncbi:MAG: hypothetical protein R3B13_08660 [Polyangiaceae bacterium]